MAQISPLDDGAQRPLLSKHDETTYRAITAENGGTFTCNLGALEAIAIVISIVIGSGVFTSTGCIDANVSSPGVAYKVPVVIADIGCDLPQGPRHISEISQPSPVSTKLML